MFRDSLCCSTATILCMVTLGCGQPVQEEPTPAASETTMPQYQVDPFWPKPLPDDMLIGEIAGLAVDAQDHVWVQSKFTPRPRFTFELESWRTFKSKSESKSTVK